MSKIRILKSILIQELSKINRVGRERVKPLFRRPTTTKYKRKDGVAKWPTYGKTGR